MISSADERLQEELWRGAIPVEVHLASDEVATADPPPPVFALVPRAAYLPVWHDAPDGPGAAFASALPPGRGASPWFDHESLPLRWNLPAGVLHDLTVSRRRAEEDRLPWRLTVHYRPNVDDASSSATRDDDGLYRCEGEDEARAHFFNALKEATHVSRGSAGAVMAMTRAARGVCGDPSPPEIEPTRVRRRRSCSRTRTVSEPPGACPCACTRDSEGRGVARMERDCRGERAGEPRVDGRRGDDATRHVGRRAGTTLRRRRARDASSDGTRRRGFPADQPGDAPRRHAIPGSLSTRVRLLSEKTGPGTERWLERRGWRLEGRGGGGCAIDAMILRPPLESSPLSLSSRQKKDDPSGLRLAP